MHGANRLASNSLLEALVYGSRVATDIANVQTAAAPGGRTRAVKAPMVRQRRSRTTAAQALSDVRSVMYSNVGLVRNEAGLREALRRIRELDDELGGASGELRNLLVVGRLIAEAALDRRESRGSHYRTDYPQADEAFAKRSFTRLLSVA